MRMSLSQTTPALLAKNIVKMLNAPVTYPEIPTDGALKAAQLIVQLMKGIRQPATSA